MRSFSVDPLFVAADRFEQLVELARFHVAGSHEHQVLEQMGEPVRPGRSRAEPTWYHMLTVTTGTL